ncbi:protein nervous wreck isoform X1 [Aphidius gifuensis]|uniref:protein nervous wreck isoform X1 n=1 Tax=Aphidius gifuensis TaxID=684658 RepID=UPI001CDCB1CD|nr:protein nervous wreck isoform X1 [Aphidius gifuensis]
MQPPPRKGNYAKFLKNVHTEQAAKLHAKNQHECDLLEDIRNFTLKKSAIEKSYSEALLKISSAYLNKKIPNIPDLKIDGAEEKWNMWNVWRTVLEENEKLARARLAAVEVFQQQIADDAKYLRMQKMQISKKAVDQLMIVQKELQMSVQEVDKTKKLYFDEEHCAHDVRDKAKDIEEKLKKKKGSFFQSITSLQKNSAKVTSKRDALDEKSTGARNDYLLSLAAANAHQNRYFAVDLQSTMQYIEQGVYDKVQEYLTLMGRTELLTCMATQNSFGIIRDQAQQLTREYNIQCCNLYYPVLKQHIQYEFEPCDNDQLDRVTADHSASTTLGKEARRWAARIAREVSNARENTRKLQALQQLKESGQKSDPNDPNGPDLETKIDDLKQAIRRAETSKMKAEAKIECLRLGGVNVEEFLQEIDTLSIHDMPRSASSLSVRTDASGAAENPSSDSFYDSDNDAGSDLTTVERPGSSARQMSIQQQQQQQQDQDDVHFDERERHDNSDVDAVVEQEQQKIEQMAADWDDDPTSIDWGVNDDKDDMADIETSDANNLSSQNQQIYKCTALYSYTAQNPDELSIVESEQLEVVGEGDGDGWLRARNYRGEEGFVPQNYLDVEREPTASVGLSSHGPGLVTQISFSSVDYTIDDHDAVDPDAQLIINNKPLSSQQQQQQQQQQDTYDVDIINDDNNNNNNNANTSNILSQYCIALYDYDATCDEELSFFEGDVLKIIKTEPHDVDDGWWEGELRGQKGIFPSLVVEPCAPDGAPLTPEDENMTPPSSAPPVFAPPEIPEFVLAEELNRAMLNEQEFDENKTQLANGEQNDGFAIKLTRGQKDHYGAQFSNESTTPEIFVVQVSDETGNQIMLDHDEDGIQNNEIKLTTEEVDEFGLGVAQIVITAATPMEEIEKSFPPTDDTNDNDDDKKKSESISQEQQEAAEDAAASARVVANNIINNNNNNNNSAPFPLSSSSGSEADSTSGPSTADNSQSTLPSHTNTVIEIMQTEMETSCDDEQACDDIIPEKMLVGGRASIPDELQPDQLEKLQNLKESNA